MTSNDLQSRVEEGRQLFLDDLELNEEDFKFRAALNRLRKDKRVKSINPYGGFVGSPVERGKSYTFSFDVKFNEVLTQDEVDKLLEEYGFPKPFHKPSFQTQLPDYLFRTENSNYQLNFLRVKANPRA